LIVRFVTQDAYTDFPEVLRGTPISQRWGSSVFRLIFSYQVVADLPKLGPNAVFMLGNSGSIPPASVEVSFQKLTKRLLTGHIRV